MLSDDRIEEIQRLRVGITDKPLTVKKALDGTGDYAILSTGDGPDKMLAEVFEKIGHNHIVDPKPLADFIAAAPTIVDDLLAERRELLEVIAELEQAQYRGE